jgi:hypothetical protein
MRGLSARSADAKKWERPEESVWVMTFTDEREAHLWEIAENLHRVELTEIERAAHVGEWKRLADGKEVEQPAQPGHPVKK